jgi:hypothetical protein
LNDPPVSAGRSTLDARDCRRGGPRTTRPAISRGEDSHRDDVRGGPRLASRGQGRGVGMSTPSRCELPCHLTPKTHLPARGDVRQCEGRKTLAWQPKLTPGADGVNAPRGLPLAASWREDPKNRRCDRPGRASGILAAKYNQDRRGGTGPGAARHPSRLRHAKRRFS